MVSIKQLVKRMLCKHVIGYSITDVQPVYFVRPRRQLGPEDDFAHADRDQRSSSCEKCHTLYFETARKEKIA